MWSVNVRKAHHVQKTTVRKPVVKDCAVIHKCELKDTESKTDVCYFLKYLPVKNTGLTVVLLMSKGVGIIVRENWDCRSS